MSRLLGIVAKRRARLVACLAADARERMPAGVTVEADPQGVVLSGRALRFLLWGRRGQPGEPGLWQELTRMGGGDSR